ncbi:MAG: type II secretion system F family protein, partial [Burkholderiales bacterium]
MRFQARVVEPGGAVASIEVAAGDAAEASARLIAEGFGVLSLRRKGRGGRGEAGIALTQFAQELRALLEAGVALIEAIQTLGEKEPRPVARALLRAVEGALAEGRSFSAALEAQGGAFPPLFVATVRASERTGSLAEALERYHLYRTQQEAVKSRLIGAAIYPVL